MMDMTNTLRSASEKYISRRFEALTKQGVDAIQAIENARNDAKHYERTLEGFLRTYEEHAYYDVYY